MSAPPLNSQISNLSQCNSCTAVVDRIAINCNCIIPISTIDDDTVTRCWRIAIDIDRRLNTGNHIHMNDIITIITMYIDRVRETTEGWVHCQRICSLQHMNIQSLYTLIDNRFLITVNLRSTAQECIIAAGCIDNQSIIA